MPVLSQKINEERIRESLIEYLLTIKKRLIASRLSTNLLATRLATFLAFEKITTSLGSVGGYLNKRTIEGATKTVLSSEVVTEPAKTSQIWTFNPQAELSVVINGLRELFLGMAKEVAADAVEAFLNDFHPELVKLWQTQLLLRKTQRWQQYAEKEGLSPEEKADLLTVLSFYEAVLIWREQKKESNELVLKMFPAMQTVRKLLPTTLREKIDRAISHDEPLSPQLLYQIRQHLFTP